MSDFQAALPRVIKWDVKDNPFDDKEKNPKSLSLFIPLQSIAAFAQHLSAMAADDSKIKQAKVWDYSNNQEVEVQGVYLNAKGKSGEYGDFGNINPASIQPEQAAACGTTPPDPEPPARWDTVAPLKPDTDDLPF